MLALLFFAAAPLSAKRFVEWRQHRALNQGGLPRQQ
jgi:hypothetical protein